METLRREMRRWITGYELGWLLLFGALAVLLAVLLAPAGANAAGGGWIVGSCRYSHTLPDDPIVYPRAPGLSHLHDFFGNRTVNAFSTYSQLLAGATTCAASSGDTAGYWVPQLRQDGKPLAIIPSGSRGIKIYYRNNLVSGIPIEPFPPDMRLVARERLGREIYWGCSNNSTGKLTAPPTSCSTGRISLHVGFPQCWDGVLTHVNDTAHVVFPTKGRCPADHAHALPRLILRLEYLVGISTGTITLSSGGPETAHGDFWNAWDQAKLERLVAQCLNLGFDCGQI